MIFESYTLVQALTTLDRILPCEVHRGASPLYKFYFIRTGLSSGNNYLIFDTLRLRIETNIKAPAERLARAAAKIPRVLPISPVDAMPV